MIAQEVLKIDINEDEKYDKHLIKVSFIYEREGFDN